MQEAHSLYINGTWTKGSGREIISINPATGKTLWQGRASDLSQLDLAISAARDSLNKWARQSVQERYEYLQTYTKALEQSQQELTLALSEETGKPLWEAKTEITAMIGKLAVSKLAYDDRCKELTKEMPGYLSKTRHRPHGVVAVLGPFNFPGHLPNGHIIPALLAGNTIVFKPSELTSRFAIKTIECWEKANLPSGVLNLVLGFSDIGQALVANQNIDGVFFTGSFATGQQIAKTSLEFPRRIVALEMGGNNPLIVYKPKDIAAAVYMTLQSAYSTAGQRCTCARRLIVCRDEAGENFIHKLVDAIKKIRVGPYTDSPEPFMGSLISQDAANKVFAAYQKLVADGAHVLVAMQKLGNSSAFLTPGLLDVTSQKQEDEEIFGPLLRLIWVDNFNEAMREANNTSYGLSAGLISEEPEIYREFIQGINAGVINWNRPTVGSSSAAPFGGLGKSGNHRPSAYYAADYCAYPVASMEAQKLELPTTLSPGIEL